MEMALQLIPQMMKLSLIVFAVIVQGSIGSDAQPEFVVGITPSLSDHNPVESPQSSIAPPPTIIGGGRAPSPPISTAPAPHNGPGDFPSISQNASRHNAQPKAPSVSVPETAPAPESVELNFPPNSPSSSGENTPPIMPVVTVPDTAPAPRTIVGNFSSAPQSVVGNSPSISPSGSKEKEQPSIPPVSVPDRTPAPQSNVGGDSSNSPSASKEKEPVNKSPISMTGTPAPAQVVPFLEPPESHPSRPIHLPSSSNTRNTPNEAPIPEALAPSPRTLPSSPQSSLDIRTGKPRTLAPHAYPRITSVGKGPMPGPTAPDHGVSPATAPRKRNQIPAVAFPPESHSPVKNQGVSPLTSPTPSINTIEDGIPVSAPPYERPRPMPPLNSPPGKAPSKHRRKRHSISAHAPSHSLISPPPSEQQGSFTFGPSSISHDSPAPSPSPKVESSKTKMPILSPKVSPFGSSSRSPKVSPVPPVQTLPPPPPNEDCSTTVCTAPYTNTPPGSPCGCVWPMKVGLRISVPLYTFFPLVSEFALEIATGAFMKQSQVHIMGANAASEQPDKTVVLVELVPLGETFDNTTAFLTYDRFWTKQVTIKASYFGDYDVLYVQYPGLPSSPPSSSIGIIESNPYAGNVNNGRAMKPLGVDVSKKRNKDETSGGAIAIIILSATVTVVLCSAVGWVLLLQHRKRRRQEESTLQPSAPSHAKPSGSAGSLRGSGLSSTSLSFGSSIAPYAGSAKTFSAGEMERVTDNFDTSRILGEGGFGRVYRGVFEDRTEAAIKVLKRDDQQGGREFLAEVEMLSRLHHRNLVKLIGICTEERMRCLVYELIPNGSVESHLHGDDKLSSPLDWDSRIKIALGAARGLAYLHEDSSPRVIHRDFKSSNILLEHDFTPKVSDFGLARAAMDEENRHISTRVMGTFGYVAPEYAMTGHLLVKSDVYSYGVVLLELLTGRKPVDMTQPPGQENLVAWARPLLTSKEGLEAMFDSSIGSDIPFDSVAKVAAIASLCVQPEVTNRPFMGEVVQALKLVCNEAKEDQRSRTSSRDDLSVDIGGAGESQSVLNYNSEPDIEKELLSASERFETQLSFRRYSSCSSLRTGKGKHFWQRVRRLSGGSVSEHGPTLRLWHGQH